MSLSQPSKMYCRKKGILFVAIDHKRPLSDQGPFDIVLHKVSQYGHSYILQVWRSLKTLSNITICYFFLQLTGKGWQQLLEVGYTVFAKTTSKISPEEACLIHVFKAVASLYFF
jgi:hypothetical protein